MALARWKRFALIGAAMVFVGVTAATSLWGGGYFYLPLAVVGLVAYGAYYVLTRVDVRNPLASPHRGPQGRFADGQPLGRALEHEDEQARDAGRRETERRLFEEDRRRSPAPPGEVGPPPHVPFP